MAESFPVWMKDTNLQILEVELTPNRITQKKIMPRHIVINLLKTKDKEKKSPKRTLSVEEYQFE